ncbi:MAG: hypothetical protein QOD99_1789 [Chthoniobacter sp.]|jgi:uncharacterized membrane protein|nr:hypothetical protein [Chthoniobacter sp.]
MLIEKTFHVHQPIHETRARLATMASYRRQLDRVTKAVITADGIAQIRFEPGLGYTLNIDLVEIPSAESDRTMFRSVGGNVEVAGMIEYFAIRENLTEVVLTLDYELKAPLARVVDSVTSVIDRFLNDQLRRMQAHFEGVGSFASHFQEDPVGNFAQAAA